MDECEALASRCHRTLCEASTQSCISVKESSSQTQDLPKTPAPDDSPAHISKSEKSTRTQLTWFLGRDPVPIPSTLPLVSHYKQGTQIAEINWTKQVFNKGQAEEVWRPPADNTKEEEIIANLTKRFPQVTRPQLLETWRKCRKMCKTQFKRYVLQHLCMNIKQDPQKRKLAQ